MTVRYYFDHHIHNAIVAALQSAGVDCLTAEDDGRAAERDPKLLDRSTALGRVLVSNDSDFFEIAKERWATGRTFAGIIRLKQDLMTIGEAIEELHLIAVATEAEEWVDRLMFLPM